MTIKYRDKVYEDPITRPRYTGVPTFMLESWPFGGIQNEETMRSILTRFAVKQRERLQEVLH